MVPLHFFHLTVQNVNVSAETQSEFLTLALVDLVKRVSHGKRYVAELFVARNHSFRRNDTSKMHKPSERDRER